MNDDDLWNLVLGNDSNGPSVTSWDETGLPADIIATLPPPQIQDTNAASLPPSALAPSGPLYDPTNSP